MSGTFPTQLSRQTTRESAHIPWDRRLGLPRDALFGYALLLPGLALIVILVGYPFGNSIWMSFHRKLIGVPDAPFVGLQNYVDLFTDVDYWIAVRNVMTYTVVSVAFKLVLGLSVAVILNEYVP
ncbi:MAG: sugar ABC transporter permease, partial [Caldilineaceae bacterium]|nr:sugar ABC transporter permease [Caldilineaceae bacterium]